MTAGTFEEELRHLGFDEIETKSVERNKRVGAHSHPFDVRARVIDGQITLICGGESRTYRAGDVFTMDAGREHAEECGPDGVTYTVGRKRRAAAA
jgi:quercetin dioxygenase-like cupin family protein